MMFVYKQTKVANQKIKRLYTNKNSCKQKSEVVVNNFVINVNIHVWYTESCFATEFTTIQSCSQS